MDVKRLSKAKQAVVADAIAAGFQVEYHEFCVDLVKRSKHAKPRVLRGLRLWQNGTAFDGTVDLSIAKGMRSADDMRAVLGLN